MKLALVLLPGLLSNERLWQHQAHYLSQIASVQIISSFGNTPKEMIQNILDKAPDVFALAGHSMGGWLCLEVMRVAPARVSKLCLLNTTAEMDSKEKRSRRLELILKAQNGQFHAIVEEITEKFVFDPHVKNKVKTMFLEVGKDAFIHQQEAMIKREETLSILSTITCPSLVIHATQDANFSLEDHQKLAREIPGAKLAVVEDSGHMSPLEMPQAITALMRFWLAYF